MLNVGGDTHWGGTPDSSPIGEQATMPTQNIRTSAKPKSRKGTSTKGKNWSSVEDKVLIQAWANTSLDAVTGTDQNSQSYWGRISEYYKAHKQPSWPERNANALNCRFGGISASTSKFCGYLQQIINKDESIQSGRHNRVQRKNKRRPQMQVRVPPPLMKILVYVPMLLKKRKDLLVRSMKKNEEVKLM
jgi:hypothetical protein